MTKTLCPDSFLSFRILRGIPLIVSGYFSLRSSPNHLIMSHEPLTPSPLMPLSRTPTSMKSRIYPWCSTQLIRRLLDIKDRPLLLPSNPIILQHPAIDSRILSLNLQHRLWRNSFKDEVVIAMWAVLVTFLEFFGIFSEGFLALLAGKSLDCIRMNW